MSNKALAVVQGGGRFAADSDKLAIWLRNEPTDPGATKEFSKTGGFKGQSVNATYIAKRLTAEFGPCGQGWGVDVEADDLLPGAPIVIDGKAVGQESVHRVRIRFWWLDRVSGEKASYVAMGQTTFVGKNKHGFFTDEEAPKKSLTDAMTKAASWLGFAADIHLGLWDDNRYVAHREAQEAKGAEPKEKAPEPPKAPAASSAGPKENPWEIASRGGGSEFADSPEKWIGIWKFRLGKVEGANKSPADKRATIAGMFEVNADVFARLHDLGHEKTVLEVSKAKTAVLARLDTQERTQGAAA